jgi:hypothetical protein
MEQLLTLAVIIAIWYVLNRYILPRLGVPT